MIRIPFFSRSQDGVSLQRCIDLAAERSGVGVDAVVQVMTLFFEGVADEMTKGRLVRVPGFGLFVPAPIPPRHLRVSRDPTPRCKPCFAPSRGLRAQVALGLGPKAENSRALARYRNNHGVVSGTSARRVFTAMQTFRDQVSSQLGRSGA